MNRRSSPLATSAPWLFASEKERFSSFRTTVTGKSGWKAASISTEPSVDPLSTTISSIGR